MTPTSNLAGPMAGNDSLCLKFGQNKTRFAFRRRLAGESEKTGKEIDVKSIIAELHPENITSETAYAILERKTVPATPTCRFHPRCNRNAIWEARP